MVFQRRIVLANRLLIGLSTLSSNQWFVQSECEREEALMSNASAAISS